jgi:ABC-2 type transport system ATP-binding protein
VKTYSGGMKRRLNIVAALLHEPALVFLDEPTAGVDPQSRHHVFDMVDGLRADGVTLIYTTHQLGEVERLCDRIVILDQGRSVAQGTLRELQQLDPDRCRSWVRVDSDTCRSEVMALLDERHISYRLEQESPGWRTSSFR